MSTYKTDVGSPGRCCHRPARIPARISRICKTGARQCKQRESISQIFWLVLQQNESQSTQELRIADRALSFIDTPTSPTRSRLHEFLQQKCLFVDTHVKRHILRGARPEQDQSPPERELWRIRSLLPKTS